MPITPNFTIPQSADLLQLPSSPSKFFIAFISSIHPDTSESWCPDVRAALPYINASFAENEEAELVIVEVGQRPEWKDPGNFFRVNWNVHNVPTLARYQLVDGKVVETGRLVGEEILDEERLQEFVRS